ncbi:MAG: hypothetical protein WCF59_00760 [Desulfobaccales bacterium]
MTLYRRFLKKLTTILTITVIFNCAAYAGDMDKSYQITSAGIIKKQGITTYMYGTHVLVNNSGKTLYALKSDNVNLDKYIDRKVTIKGNLIGGYPVEGGPDYLNVQWIE